LTDVNDVKEVHYIDKLNLEVRIIDKRKGDQSEEYSYHQKDEWVLKSIFILFFQIFVKVLEFILNFLSLQVLLIAKEKTCGPSRKSHQGTPIQNLKQISRMFLCLPILPHQMKDN